MTHETLSDGALAEIRQFVMAERARCLSEREWHHRLAGYGYGLRHRGEEVMITALPGGTELCALG